MVAQDIVPFAIAQGDRALPVGVNHVGMKRRGYSEEAVRAVRQAFKVVFRSGILLEAALAQIESTYPDQPEITQFVRFIKGSQRGIAR
jgi:UDP-N-acetylglucosamine acyltransferase